MARPPETCPNCGAEVPPKASACPECGADETTGWSERAAAQNLGLPDEEFDYEEFVRNEFGPEARHADRPRRVHWFWLIVALIVAAAFLLMYLEL